MKIPSLMKKIDKALFNNLEKVQTSTGYNKFLDFYSGLEDSQQKIIKHISVMSVIIIPLLIVLLFMKSNSNAQAQLDLRTSIITKANSLIQAKSSVRSLSRVYFGDSFVDSEGSFKSKITGLLNIAGVDASKIKMSGFEKTEQASLITKIKADIKFDNLSNEELFNSLIQFTRKSKVRIDEINIQKDQESSMLRGIMSVHYFSKALENTNE
ncbi:MAG: hypothetical protein N4A33_06750 [Bacteriovoracaceae bacterium]|jgi:hypothetical protein|nr:hypothetical protein [Bacteriovoracaceae bacterium]